MQVTYKELINLLQNNLSKNELEQEVLFYSISKDVHSRIIKDDLKIYRDDSKLNEIYPQEYWIKNHPYLIVE